MVHIVINNEWKYVIQLFFLFFVCLSENDFADLANPFFGVDGQSTTLDMSAIGSADVAHQYLPFVTTVVVLSLQGQTIVSRADIFLVIHLLECLSLFPVSVFSWYIDAELLHFTDEGCAIVTFRTPEVVFSRVIGLFDHALPMQPSTTTGTP